MNTSGEYGGTARAVCEGAECAQGGSGAGQVSAAARSRLCLECRDQFMMRLKGLPMLYEECERRLSGTQTGLREKASGGSLPGMPFNGAAADIRSAILTTLGSWSGLVAAERQIAAPPRSVDTLAAFLVQHAHWLAAHPAVADATGELARLSRAAYRVTQPAVRRRVRVGACVAVGCTGELAAHIRGQGRDAEIVCDADADHSWPGHAWTELRRRMQQPGPAVVAGPCPERWLSVADISRLWDLSTSSVYRLASERQWRRRRDAGRVRYAESDVHDSLSRRAAPTWRAAVR
ncbi:hypothetical protein AB0I10_31060 [Streptomyces sp. NPDC050636]|uniref:hypothetical protein n=1 Tax=Streptomyces sp. NPDC050636 TaxID=3154510 RepID=UPI00342CDA53